MNGDAPGPLATVAGYVLLAAFALLVIPACARALAAGLHSGTIRFGRWQGARARDGGRYWLIVGACTLGLLSSAYTIVGIARRFGWIG